MNHRAFQSRRQIRGRLGGFGVVPNRHFISRRQLQHAIEIVLSRAAPVVDQLSNAESMNRVAALLHQAAVSAETPQTTSRLNACSFAVRSLNFSFNFFERFISEIDRQLQLHVGREFDRRPLEASLAKFECLPDPFQPRFVRSR